ncbi:DUF3014 domain-containing protein [Noviherbaspirillum agri]
MKKVLGWMLVLILLGVGAFALYLWKQGRYEPLPPLPLPAPAPSVEAPPPAAGNAEPVIQYPVPETAETQLPPLARSDSTALAALADVLGKNAVKQFFQSEEVIRRIVVTVDNLPRKVVSAQLMPTKPVEGKLRTDEEGEKLVLAPANHDRYTPFVRLADMVDAKTFVAAYVRLYPLFQQAYREQGYPKGYFNDRLVAVIDHMLEAPEVDGPIALVQPRIYYQFADPELESLSAGHKLMLRIGSRNAARVKAKLQEIRSELVAAAPAAE